MLPTAARNSYTSTSAYNPTSFQGVYPVIDCRVLPLPHAHRDAMVHLTHQMLWAAFLGVEYLDEHPGVGMVSSHQPIISAVESFNRVVGSEVLAVAVPHCKCLLLQEYRQNHRWPFLHCSHPLNTAKTLSHLMLSCLVGSRIRLAKAQAFHAM